MDDLTPLERDLQRFLADGGSEEALLTNNRSHITILEHRITVAFEDANGDRQTIDVSELLSITGLRDALAETIGQRVHEIQMKSLDEELGKLFKFVSFLHETKNPRIGIGELNNALLTCFCDWLNDLRSSDIQDGRRSPYAARQREGGKPLATEYKREIYRVVINYLRRIRLLDRYAGEFDPALDLLAHQTWTVSGRKKPTSILTRPQLKMLVRLCREEVGHSTRRLRAFWSLTAGEAAGDHPAPIDPAIVSELRTVRLAFPELPPPSRDEFRKVTIKNAGGGVEVEFSSRTCPKLWAMNGPQYKEAISLLYPTARQMLPFCLLFGIYFRYNPSVLAVLRKTDLKLHPGALGERIHGAPFKNRAGRKQHASWPVTEDAHNPAEMIKTIERWTSLIRGHEPDDQAGHLFLYRNNNRDVRSFAVVHAFDRALSSFIKDHRSKLTTVFTMRSIRPSVIDLVHHLFDGDVVAASHAGHHRSVDTTIEHYLYDGARKRNDEALVPVVHSMNRWVQTDGTVDPRNTTSGDFLGATPGWECRNPYLGVVAGESPDELCRAYGRCPTCELGKLDRGSPVSFALNVKLREAVLRARTSMTEHAWLERWQPVADRLDRTLELTFSTEAKRSADLDIPDLPTVE